MKHGLLNPTLKSAAAFKHCPIVHHNDSLKLHQHDWLIPWWIQCPQLCGADCNKTHMAHLFFCDIFMDICGTIVVVSMKYINHFVSILFMASLLWKRMCSRLLDWENTQLLGAHWLHAALTTRIAFHFSLLISVKTLHFVWEGNINIRTSSLGGVLPPLLAWKWSTMNMCENLLSGHFLRYACSAAHYVTQISNQPNMAASHCVLPWMIRWSSRKE